MGKTYLISLIVFITFFRCINDAIPSDKGDINTQKMQYQIFNKFIVFYIDEKRAVQVYKFIKSKDINEYSGKPLFESKTEDEGRFVNIEGSLLIFDYGTSPSPHEIAIYDLDKQKNVVSPRVFYYFPNLLHLNGKYRIYKHLGKMITPEQYRMINKNEIPKAEGDSEINYYEEYIYYPIDDEIRPNNRVIAVLESKW